MTNLTRFECLLSAGLILGLFLRSTLQSPQSEKSLQKPSTNVPALVLSKPLKMDSDDDELRKLLKARYNEALGELRDYYEEKDLSDRHGITRRGDPDDLYGPWRRLIQAGLELSNKPEERVALLTQYLQVTKEAEKVVQERYDAGRVRVGPLHRARYERLDAEIQLLRARPDDDKPKEKR